MANDSHRERLFTEVKEEYGRIASDASQQTFRQSTSERTPEAYYEELLHKTLSEIEKGTFDSFQSGADIVNAVANDKSWLS